MPALWRILATGVSRAYVTKVIRIISDNDALSCLVFAVCGAARSAAQLRPRRQLGRPAQAHSAEALYAQLRSVGLDKSRVYNIREVTLERAAFHITFDDGTIAFTEDVAGHVTGAFFEGEGEVLLIPNDQAERASMMLFTGRRHSGRKIRHRIFSLQR